MVCRASWDDHKSKKFGVTLGSCALPKIGTAVLEWGDDRRDVPVLAIFRVHAYHMYLW